MYITAPQILKFFLVVFLFLEAYLGLTPTDRTVNICFRQFKRVDFDVQNKEPLETKFEEAELELILN